MTANSPLRIGLLLYQNCMPTGHFGFADLVYAANRRAGRPVFELVFVAVQMDTVICAHGHRLTPESTLLECQLDAVLIPPCWMESLEEIEEVILGNRPMVSALAKLGKNVTLMAYCSGVSFVAASGRLNAEPATVAWWLSDLMRRQYPTVLWKVEQECVVSRRAITAANGHAYQLIAKELMDKYIARNTYHEMTKMMERPALDHTHEAFQAMDLAQQGDEFMRNLFLVAQTLPAADVSVRKLADELGTTERTLARKVIASAGIPAASYLRRVKLHQVSERLIRTSTPASAISSSLGFSTESAMRRMFKDLTGMTPLEYRNFYKRAHLPSQTVE